MEAALLADRRELREFGPSFGLDIYPSVDLEFDVGAWIVCQANSTAETGEIYDHRRAAPQRA